MKRFGRIFTGIAAIMLGIGIILVAVGIGRIKAEWDGTESFQDTGSVSRELEQAERINVEVPFGLLRMESSPDDKIRFYAENINENNLLVRSSSSEAEIRMRTAEGEIKELSLFHLNIPFIEGGALIKTEDWRNAPVYVLMVPENYGGAIRADVALGKIEASGIQASELELRTDLGNISAGDCEVSELRMEAATGIVWTEGCTAERAEVKCKAGNVRLEGNFAALTADIGMGELFLEPGRPESAYHGSVSAVFGQITCSTPGRYGNLGQREGLHFGRMEIVLPGREGGELRAACRFGTIDVTFRNDRTD